MRNSKRKNQTKKKGKDHDTVHKSNKSNKNDNSDESNKIAEGADHR